MRATRLIIALALGLWALPAHADPVFPTQWPGITAPGRVIMCQTTIGTFAPCGSPGALPLPVAPVVAAPTPSAHASVSALGTSLVAKAAPGNLLGFNCTAITGGAAGFCIAYNGSSVPNTGALTGSLVLDACAFDTGTKGCSLSRIPLAVFYSSGIVILVTSASTPFTYTTGTDTAYISADFQ